MTTLPQPSASDSGFSSVPPSVPPASPPAGPGARPPRRRFSIWAIVATILLAGSVLVNLLLLAAVVGLAAFMGAGDIESTYVEKVIEHGPSNQKIAVIRIDGLIDEAMAEQVHGALQHAARDDRVKAVVLRINSPGGGLTASDMIHHDIRALLKDAGKPVVASMDAVAASGGYYIACAADQVVAQQTTITGSIGVIAQFFFINGLLQDKLGVTTVTLKMGQQKDWPNLFAAGMTPEQQDYLMSTLLRPGYDQFVDIVAQSRQKHLTRDQVLQLATGRIFMAKEAKDKGLIDQIGYFEDAVDEARKLANLSEAQVVEYVQPFHLLDLLSASSKSQTMLDLRPERLAALASPKVMYLWTGY